MKQHSSLSDQCREIILGAILGDGSLKIHTPYRNARFSFRHSTTQREYFLWKVERLKEISAEKCMWAQPGKDGWGGDKLRYQSKALPVLTELYELTHKRGPFRIRRKWLNQLTPLSLCIWWLDDGSLLNGKQGVFCTDGFLYEDLLIATRYFRKVWGVNPRIGRVAQVGARSNQYRLWLRSQEDLQKFLRIILPCMRIPSMLKKVVLLYKDPELQERWISEVAQHTGFECQLVDACVQEQKSKLKRFRE